MTEQGRQSVSAGGEYADRLEKLVQIQRSVADTHPFLERLFPVAVVEDDLFHIYDLGASGEGYACVQQAPIPMPIPHGVRAAFPLECHENRVACIVTGEVFDSLDGYATLLHEFAHCGQWETCEPALREELGIAHKAKAENDYMWEINYPFPYDDPQFVRLYEVLLRVTVDGERDDVLANRKQLKESLSESDFEYMAWQEWKEGLARCIENRVRDRLGLQENHGGQEVPFSRVSFYEGGARLIAAWAKYEPDSFRDAKGLFYRLLHTDG